MLDYQLLTALAAIIREGGFEKAANKLFITQSAVSRRIQTLESLIGEPVMVRSKPPRLTDKGKQLLNHYQQVMQLELELGINAFDQNDTQDLPLTIRLATNADSLTTWLPEALGLYNEKSERLFRFDLVVEDQSIVLNRMKSGEVMACISSESKAVHGGNMSYLGNLRYRAVASPRFIQRYQIHSLQQVVNSPCLAFDENDQLQHQFLSEVANTEPLFVHYCPSPEGFKLALIAGLGFGLLPELQIDDSLSCGQLALLDPDYKLDVPLYWHYWQSESSHLRALRTLAQSVAHQRLRQA